MNKKMQKGIVAAVAATMGTGIVAPVYAASAETTDLAGKYAKAYEATVNAKTQKELTEARKLVDALYAEVKGTPDEYLATTLSSLLDPVQQKELVKLDEAIKAAETKATQANVNAARALIVDMPEVWKNAFSSYIDTIQNEIIASAVEAIEAAVASGVQADLDAANALYNELLTVTNNDGVKSWVETALKAELDKVVVAAKVQSVTVVASKKIEVKFNQPVDSAKAVFTVKRDGIKSNVTATTWNTDKTAATIELTSKVSKAEYAVEVSGVAVATLTGAVKAEDERVAKIEVLSTEVALSDLDGDNAIDDLSVPYKVSNQYGEDITKTTTLVASNGSVDPTNGVVKFEGNYDITTNKTVAFTLINVDSNVSTTAIVTAVSAAKESSIEIKGVYNKDGKTLTETTDLTKDKFFVEIEVKDQYGNVVKSPDGAQLILSESNTTVVDVDDTAGVPTLDTTTVSGKVLIPLKKPSAGLKAGESTIILISKNTGKSARIDVKVAEGVRATNVVLGQPELVAAGEDALIPVSAFDQQGNEIKDLDVLNDSVRGLSLETGNTLILKDNVVYVKIPGVTVGPKVAIVTVKPTQKIVTVNFTVKETAVPKTIVGLDSAIQTSISAGLSQAIKAKDLIIEDQHGRVMTDAKVEAWMTGTNRIVVTSSYDASDDKSPFVVVTSAVGDTNDGKNVLASKDETLTVTALTTAGLNATEKLTFALSTDSGATTIATSAKDVVFSRVGITDFVSYEVSAPAAIYNDTTEYNFKVYGVKADGSKTLLNANQYNVVYTESVFNLNGANNNKVSLKASLDTIDDDSATTDIAQSKDYTFKVVITDSAATTINKVVKVSAEARKVVDFKVASDGTSSGTELSKLVYEASTASNDADIVDLDADGTLDISVLENNLYYVDQYGKETTEPVAGTIYLTFANIVDNDTTVPVVVTSNGSDSTKASVSKLEAGDKLKTTITIGSITKTFDVEIK